MINNLNKILLFLFLFILIFISAFQNFNGVLSHYLIQYEYLDHRNIFKLNEWTEYVENSAQFLPLRIISNLGFKFNNDFFIFFVYFFNGLIALFSLNKILLKHINIKDFNERIVFIICISSANFVIFSSVFSSIYNPFLNVQTSFTITLFYLLFYLVVNKSFFFASIISAIMILFHLSVAWLPVSTFIIFLIFQSRFRSFRIFYSLIPAISFFFMYSYNIEVLNNQSSNSIQVIENIFSRSEEENSIMLQPNWRIIYFIISLPFYYLINKNFIENKNLKLFFNLIFFISILTTIFGLFYTTVGYKYIPIVSLSYLYFVRAMMSYHIIFAILITYYVFRLNISLFLKFSFYLSIYILGKMMISSKAVILASIIIAGGLLVEFFILKKNKKYYDNISYKKVSYYLCLFFLITHIFWVNKNNLNKFDPWTYKNLSDWTQYNNFFSEKKDSYKNNLISLRKCNDFILLPIIKENNIIRHDYYINFITHKSLFILDGGMLYYSHEKFSENKKKGENFHYLIENLKSNKELDNLDFFFDFENLVLFVDFKLYLNELSKLKTLEDDIIKFDQDFILIVKNKRLKKK